MIRIRFPKHVPEQNPSLRGVEHSIAARVLSSGLRSGIGWSLFGSVASRVLTLGANLILARLLGVELLGLFVMVLATLMVVQTLSTYSVGLTLTRTVADFQQMTQDALGRAMTLLVGAGIAATLSFAAALLWVADDLSSSLGLGPRGGELLRIGVILLIPSAILNIVQSILTGFQAFREIALSNLVYGVGLFALVIPLTAACGVSGTIAGTALANAVTVPFVWKRATALARFHGIVVWRWPEKKDLSILTSYSLPAFISGIVVMPVTWWYYSWLSSSTNGFVELGLFNVADQWRTVILFVPSSINAVLLPVLSSYFTSDPPAFRWNLKMVLGTELLVALALSLFVIVFREDIVALYGEGFLGSASVLLLLAGCAPIQAVCNVMGHVLASANRMWYAAALNLTWALVIVASVIVIFERTAAGLASSLLVGYGVFMLMSAGMVVTRIWRVGAESGGEM